MERLEGKPPRVRGLFHCLPAFVLACAIAPLSQAEPVGLTPEQTLGRALFFDPTLSHPSGQSCAGCHAPTTAFSSADRSTPTSAGVTGLLLGSRNAPTAMYSAFSPTFGRDAEGAVVGGQFLDGRAATLEAQARGPFVNPIEMANPDAASVIEKLRASPNAALFESVYGQGALSNVETAYVQVAQAIAAFERTPELAPFSSKYDAYLDGSTQLSADELAGLRAFEDPMKGNCAACHPGRPTGEGRSPLFTDFTYDNLGVPRNPHNRFYDMPSAFNPEGHAFVDRGLGATTGDSGDDGKFKVPTLRNIALTAAYMHNGYFATLESVVDFYNTRDMKPACVDPFTGEADALRLECWPAAEVPMNVNGEELGNLGLSPLEVRQVVAFLETLTDGWNGTASEPGSLVLLAAGVAALLANRRRL
jgi:cytochrome c peroxidase